MKIDYNYQKHATFTRYFNYELNLFLGEKNYSEYYVYGSAKTIGAFQPLADMYKDFRDTFSAYKGLYQQQNDLKQPLRGLGNIFKSIGIIGGTLIFFVLNLIRLAFRFMNKDDSSEERVNLARTGAWLIEGASTMIRGLTQVATTPLTYLIKIPLRILITKIKGEQKIEENNGIHREITNALRRIDEKCNNQYGRFWYSDGQMLRDTVSLIHYDKFIKCRDLRDQKTDIDSEKEKDLFNAASYAGHEMTTEGYDEQIKLSKAYFALFQPKANRASSPPPSPTPSVDRDCCHQI